MEARSRDGAADGFIVQFITLPSGIHRFVDLVVPELQRRGLTRTEYQERTLRKRFGLERPRIAITIGDTHAWLVALVRPYPGPRASRIVQMEPLRPRVLGQPPADRGLSRSPNRSRARSAVWFAPRRC